MTKIPPDGTLESLYKLRRRESDPVKTVVELYDMAIHQKTSMPDRNERIETGAVVTSHRGLSSIERGKGVCYQWKAKGQRSRGDKCSFGHNED